MAVEHPVLNITITASASVDQYTFVSHSGANPSAGARAIGVAQESGTSGRGVAVAVSGVSKVKAGGTVTAGSLAAVGSGGTAVNATAGNVVAGVFLTGGSSGDLVSLLVHPVGHVAA